MIDKRMLYKAGQRELQICEEYEYDAPLKGGYYENN